MAKQPKGKLMIIGGAEKNHDGMPILEAFAAEVRRLERRLLIINAASTEPQLGLDEYLRIFRDLGIKQIETLDVATRAEAYDDGNAKMVADASGIFFTGGDQLRITSQLGDSPIYRTMIDRYHDGSIIAGTSAGAAAMPETMITGGPGDESDEISALSMAPGLGLLGGVVIDSHFAERGRMSRLLGAVAQNPRNVGLGIDESTAILVTRGKEFQVIGAGAVYVVDGTRLTYSGLSDEHPEGIVTLTDITLHVLAEGDRYDLKQRRPVIQQQENERAAASADD